MSNNPQSSRRTKIQTLSGIKIIDIERRIYTPVGTPTDTGQLDVKLDETRKASGSQLLMIGGILLAVAVAVSWKAKEYE